MEEENKTQREVTVEERLANIEIERKNLREEVARKRKYNLEHAAEVRASRDSKLEEISRVLGKIQKKIFAYNKTGKVGRAQIEILKEIEFLATSTPLED